MLPHKVMAVLQSSYEVASLLTCVTELYDTANLRNAFAYTWTEGEGGGLTHKSCKSSLRVARNFEWSDGLSLTSHKSSYWKYNHLQVTSLNQNSSNHEGGHLDC